MPGDHFAYIWEYDVLPEQETGFLAHYAPGGTWAALFRRAPGYLGTELYRDRARPTRFLTVDHWADEAAFRSFRRRFEAEFDDLDRRCAQLTRREASLGEFSAAALPPADPGS